ncbi:MAG: hypothetical protein JXR25_16835 [Pontiellaceae bacterium]|nr:hypothetical protein [Pontiellaceae bacterium]MBN2786489.1 hypothetical protein [Pontiellaceae bacterium]
MGDEKYVSDKMRPDGPSETAVLWFAGAMLEKLRKNARKGPWSVVDGPGLIKRMREEMDELVGALYQQSLVDLSQKLNGQPPPYDKASAMAVVNEAADVANFAMFIADNARRAAGIEDVNPWAEHNAFLERSAKYEHGMCEEMERLVRRLSCALKVAVRCLDRQMQTGGIDQCGKESDAAIRVCEDALRDIGNDDHADEAWHLNQAVMH